MATSAKTIKSLKGEGHLLETGSDEYRDFLKQEDIYFQVQK
jgi:hypothetical protein